MSWFALLLSLLLAGGRAQAATIVGRDCGGANLVCDGTVTCGGVTCNNGDFLQGTFLNVGLFSIGGGTTVSVSPASPLAVYASSVSIAGILEGTGLGQPGGRGGGFGNAGLNGAGGSSSGSGFGGGGAAQKGGGGAGHGAAGGTGAGAGGGSAGAVYGSTGVVTSPLSADDAFMGSGGGGGGGGATAANGSGTDGGAGGADIYIEAASMTVTGAIRASGLNAATVAGDGGGGGSVPGAGGGGSGGTVLLRITGAFAMSGSTIAADGGNGGNVDDALFCRTPENPGGGGGGGRIKLFTRTSSSANVALSTSAGQAGNLAGFCGAGQLGSPAPVAGSSGTVSFGIVASSPTNFGVQAVYVTSIAWSWNNAVNFGDAGANSRLFRVFPASATAPLTNPQVTAGSLATGATETALTPNTTYFRFVTAYTDWGDSYPSTSVSSHTLANSPGTASPTFTSMGNTSLTVNWTGGAPANPAYTSYEVDQSLDPNFASGVSVGFIVGLSSAPTGLSPNTTYYFRARAINLDNVPSSFSATFATATLATTPSNPAVAAVAITSVAFSWATGGNPPYTLFNAQISTDNFNTLAASSMTLGSSATFFNLTPGTLYFFRVSARNLDSVDTAFTAIISTAPGNLTTSSPPSIPGAPQPDRATSFDGTVVFSWSASQSPVGIFDYFLEIGSQPGGNDVFSGFIGNTLTYTRTGLASGKSYYAHVRARSNAGALSDFSPAGSGVAVFIPAQVNAISKPYNWPNPFDPQAGPTNIAFFLSQPATVELKIFTLQGQLVHEESDDLSSAGNQHLTWNGSNDNGRRVAPGGYIAMIVKHYPGSVETQKLKIAVLY